MLVPNVELSVGRVGMARAFDVGDRRSSGPNGWGRTGSVFFETGENWVRHRGSDVEQVANWVRHVRF
jgi:hypothetical protein